MATKASASGTDQVTCQEFVCNGLRELNHGFGSIESAVSASVGLSDFEVAQLRFHQCFRCVRTRPQRHF